MNESLSIQLSKELATALDAESRESGLSKGKIARQALEALLVKSGRLSVMQRHFGAISGPSDLSTGKSYRRAWKKRQA